MHASPSLLITVGITALLVQPLQWKNCPCVNHCAWDGFGLGGYIYHKFFKWLVLHKMENAFRPGDPILELLALGKQVQNPADSTRLFDTNELHWILREQAKIDAIVNGSDRGHYHLLIGDRGT